MLAQLHIETDRTIDLDPERPALVLAQTGASVPEIDCPQAITALDIKQLTIDGGPKPTCVEERQMVVAAKQRLRYAEQQVATLRRMLPRLRHEADEYHGVLGKLTQLVDTDLPAAMADLDRMVEALQRYTMLREPTAGIGTLPPRSGNSASRTPTDLPSSSDGDQTETDTP